MARSTADIKQEIVQYWMSEEAAQRAYGVEPGADFDAEFSKSSIESIKFYIQAVAVWALEKLFDIHKAEITAIIDELKPHSLRWYVSKAKAFLLGLPLVPDTDRHSLYIEFYALNTAFAEFRIKAVARLGAIRALYLLLAHPVLGNFLFYVCYISRHFV